MRIPEGALRCRLAPTPNQAQTELVPDMFVGTDEHGYLRVYRTSEPIIHTPKEPRQCN